MARSGKDQVKSDICGADDRQSGASAAPSEEAVVKRSFVSLLVVSAVGAAMLPAAMAFAGPAGPTNLGPDDSNLWAKNVVLTWDDVAGATGYEVEVTNDGFSTDGPVLQDTAQSNRYVMPVDLPRGDYLWRVRATLPAGNSDWSGSAALLRGWDPSVAPTITALGADNLDWSIAWAPVPDASFYEVEYSKVPTEPGDGGTPVAKEDVITCFTTHTTFTGFLLSKGAERPVADGAKCEGTLETTSTYNVRVRGRDGSVDDRTTPFNQPVNTCTGIWQSTVGTGTDGNVPECTNWSNEITGLQLNNSTNEPSLPTGLATNDFNGPCSVASPCTDTPVMSWDQDPDAKSYRVYLSRDRSGNDVDRLYQNIVGTHFQMSDTMFDRELPWYWRVQACGFGVDDAACGPVSAPSSFLVSNKALKLTGAAPIAGDPDVKEQFVDFTIPTEIAQADHQANAFRIQISTKADFSAVVQTDTFDQQAGNATTTSYRWEDAPDGTYYWRYRALDQTGLTSPWSEDSALKFTVDGSVPKVSINTSSGWGLADSVTLKSDKALSGVTSNSLGVALKDGARLSGKITPINSTSWKFTPDTKWIANAAYVPFVDTSVTSSNGKVAVGDDVVRRPGGIVDSKTSSMKKINGDFKWNTLSASDAIGNSYVAAKHKASSNKVPSVSAKFGGGSVAVYACKSSASGIADVYVDGAKLKSIDLYRASSNCGLVWEKSGLGDSVHTIEIKVPGKKSSASSGTFVGVDAIKAG